MSDQFLAEIRLFSFNFAPKGWAFCDGRLLPINQYQALFALLGTTYGGNGTTNFGLPDLRSRVPVHVGDNFVQGEQSGTENVTLLVTEIPTHFHMLQAVNAPGGAAAPVNHSLAQSGTTHARYAAGSGNVVTLNPASIQPAGNNAPHTNLQPYLAMNYCIALSGLFPSRG